MTNKHVIVLLALVLVVGGAGVYMFRHDAQTWQAQEARLGQKVLPKLQVADVARILIRQGKDTVTLTREGDTWHLKERGGYPADGALVAEFLIKARDWKVMQSEPITDAQRPRVDLAPPDAAKNAATQVELQDKDGKVLETLLLGKKHLGKPPLQVKGFDKGQPDGRYLIVASEPGTLVLINDPLNSIEPKPEKFVSKEFLRVDRIRSLEVETGDAATSYRLTRDKEAADWVLAGLGENQKTDPSAAVSATNALYSMSFTDVAQIKPDALEKPTTITAETFDGWKYVMRVAPKPGEAGSLYFNAVVTGEFKPTDRAPGKDEKPEDKEKRDKEHAERMDQMARQLAREKTYAPWVHVVERKQLERLLVERSKFVEQPEPAPDKKG